MTTPDVFSELTSSLYSSPWQAAYAEGLQLAAAANPAGFAPEVPGLVAWDLLSPADRDDALRELFYTYAEAVEMDEATAARLHRERLAEQELTYLLARYRQARGFRHLLVRHRLSRQIASLASVLIGGAR